MLKVYFAGPVTNNYWRNKIFGFNPLLHERTPPTIDFFKYAGPFVSNSRDDSLKHYEVCYAYANERDPNDFTPYDDNTVFIENPTTVFDRSLANIDNCDIVFAYIDSVYNTGTLAEIMYAYAKNKYIVAVVNSRLDEMDIWFTLEAVNEAYIYSTNLQKLEDFWDAFVRDNPFSDYYKMSNAQEFVIQKYYKDSDFVVVLERINKYEAISLIAAIKNPKYDITEIQDRLIKKGALIARCN